MAKATNGCPPDWQQQAMKKKEELQANGPLFGIILPAAWAPELSAFQQEIRKLLHVPRVAFSGSTVAAMEEPTED